MGRIAGAIGVLSAVICMQGQDRKPDFQNLGPAIGAAMPDFELPDQDGKKHTLKSLVGPKGAFLVFFRSADW